MCDSEGSLGERLVGRGTCERSSWPSYVTTRRGRVRPPTVQTPKCLRGSRTLAEGFRGRTTSCAERYGQGSPCASVSTPSAPRLPGRNLNGRQPDGPDGGPLDPASEANNGGTGK